MGGAAAASPIGVVPGADWWRARHAAAGTPSSRLGPQSPSCCYYVLPLFTVRWPATVRAASGRSGCTAPGRLRSTQAGSLREGGRCGRTSARPGWGTHKAAAGAAEDAEHLVHPVGGDDVDKQITSADIPVEGDAEDDEGGNDGRERDRRSSREQSRTARAAQREEISRGTSRMYPSTAEEPQRPRSCMAQVSTPARANP